MRTDIDWPDAAAAVHCNAPRGKTLREGQESNVRSDQEQSLSFARGLPARASLVFEHA